MESKKPILRAAFSVENFCAAHGFTKPTFYKLQREGIGPRIMRVGRRVLISTEAAAEWRRAMEARSNVVAAK